MMWCNTSWPQLTFKDPRLRLLLDAADDGSLTLQGVCLPRLLPMATCRTPVALSARGPQACLPRCACACWAAGACAVSLV